MERPEGIATGYSDKLASGHSFSATIVKYDKFVVSVRVFRPDGELIIDHDIGEHSYDTLEDAKAAARSHAIEFANQR